MIRLEALWRFGGACTCWHERREILGCSCNLPRVGSQPVECQAHPQGATRTQRAMSPRRQAASSPRSLSGDPQHSICSDGAAGSGKDCSCQRKKRRHPVARVKGNWLPDEDERLRQYVFAWQTLIRPLQSSYPCGASTLESDGRHPCDQLASIFSRQWLQQCAKTPFM